MKNMKICVISLGLFGDVIARTPVIRALKEKYPNSKITVVVDKIGYEILKNNPYIHEIITMDRKKSNYLKYIYFKISTQIKLIIRRFDLMIDLYNGSSSRSMAKLSFAKQNIKNKKGTNVYNFKNPLHMTNSLFEMISDIKFDNVDISPDFFINKYIYKNSQKFQNSYLLSLGSGDLNKILSFDKTFKLIKHIYKNYALIPTIVQNPGQEFLQEKLINEYLIPNEIPYIKLDKKSIDELAIIIKNSKFIIVPDTGIMHLSFALKTPVFCVFTETNPIIVEPENDNIILKSSYKLANPPIYDRNGVPKCTGDIEIKTIIKDFDEFMGILKSKS
ncbi:MAG: glycosyltransferase family 9 protein [Campylobacteraceae bacterium]|nr:glycosyltransferase family 9 protein [Campylobacteraceae bacterium]